MTILPTSWRRRHNRNVRTLYGAIVAQARSVAFYTAYGVPDTVEGRYELVVLHLVLLLRRLGWGLRNRHPEGQPSAASKVSSATGQRLFDVFCADLDDNLREMGVGDLAVPRRMRQLGEAFYGRNAVYQAALAEPDRDELLNALARNVYARPGVDRQVEQLADYVLAAIAKLDAASVPILSGESGTAGDIGPADLFPDPELLNHA